MSDNTKDLHPSPTAIIPLQQPTSGAGLVKATELISAMMTRGLTARQASIEFEIPFLDVVEMLGNPTFLRHFSHIRREAARASFHASVHDAMENIVKNGKPMEKIAASTAWSTILGEKSHGTIKHEHSWIEDTIKRLKSNGKIIDIEVLDDQENIEGLSSEEREWEEPLETESEQSGG